MWETCASLSEVALKRDIPWQHYRTPRRLMDTRKYLYMKKLNKSELFFWNRNYIYWIYIRWVIGAEIIQFTCVRVEKKVLLLSHYYVRLSRRCCLYEMFSEARNWVHLTNSLYRTNVIIGLILSTLCFYIWEKEEKKSIKFIISNNVDLLLSLNSNYFV